VGSLLAPAVVRHVRPAAVLGGGVGLAALGFAVLTQVGALGLPALVGGTTILYLGLGPVFTLGTDLIVGAAPPERAGAAAAISETSSELGGAVGIALLGSFGTFVYRAAMARASLSGITPEAVQAARDTLGGAVASAATLSHELADQLLEVARRSFTKGLQLTAAVCAIVATATAVAAFRLLGTARENAGSGGASVGARDPEAVERQAPEAA